MTITLKEYGGRSMGILVKRVYDKPEEADGCRILVDRLWARGLTKEKAGVDVWAKMVAPSTALRNWYDHDPDKWPEFKTRYATELEANKEEVEKLLVLIQAGTVTFLYSSKERRLNNAVALKEYIESIN
jgi:uncharacterized protein YeaO (DUF488 family)